MGVDARMLVKLAAPVDDAALVVASYQLAEALGHRSEVFWLASDDDLAKGDKRRALNRVTNDSDGDYRACGIADFSGAWLWVSLWGRYYGDGYERGDLWAYVAIAEWIERRFPLATVYYGGDSSDRIDLFGKSAREELIAHWADEGGRPYYAREGKDGRWTQPNPLQPTCPLCEQPATQYGTGQQFASWTCDGCSRHWLWIGGEVVKAFPPSRGFDSFKAAKEMREALSVADDERDALRLAARHLADRPAPSDLLARLRDYHDQVLQGFRHMSRLEEADLIQAAIDGLRQKEGK